MGLFGSQFQAPLRCLEIRHPCLLAEPLGGAGHGVGDRQLWVATAGQAGSFIWPGPGELALNVQARLTWPNCRPPRRLCLCLCFPLKTLLACGPGQPGALGFCGAWRGRWECLFMVWGQGGMLALIPHQQKHTPPHPPHPTLSAQWGKGTQGQKTDQRARGWWGMPQPLCVFLSLLGQS